ncbi:Os02g0233566, partial [Oryza sativa Japonica Group]
GRRTGDGAPRRSGTRKRSRGRRVATRRAAKSDARAARVKGRKKQRNPRFLSGVWSPRINSRLCTRLGGGWAALAKLGISSSTLCAMNSEI